MATLCIEILHNGKRLCVIGHEKAGLMQVHLAYLKRDGSLTLTTHAYVQQTPELTEVHCWLDERPQIHVGDTIELKISDDLVPEPGRVYALYCSFCGKSQYEVRKLIAGPSVFICDECIQLCNDILREEDKTNDAPP